MQRTVNVFIGIRFQMMIAMIPHPRDRIAGKRHGRTGGKKEFQPFRHLESAMGQIPMQIKCRADSAPEKKRQHDGQIERSGSASGVR